MKTKLLSFNEDIDSNSSYIQNAKIKRIVQPQLFVECKQYFREIQITNL